MWKILGLIILSLFIAKNGFADNEMPERARPDDKTISLYEYKKKIFIKNRREQGRLYTIKPKGNAKVFNYEKNISSSKLESQLSNKTQIYPNPAKNQVHIKSDMFIGQLFLRNIQGEILKTIFINNNELKNVETKPKKL